MGTIHRPDHQRGRTGRGPGAAARGAWVIAVAVLALFAPPSAGASEAGWAAAGSLFLPGIGQVANGETAKAAAHFGVYAASVAAAVYYVEHDDYIEFDDRYDDDDRIITTNRASERAELFGRAALGTAFYSSYDAYRTRRMQLGNRGYRTPTPPDTLADLARAPFRGEYLTRWTTLAPLAVAASTLFIPVEDSWVTTTDDTITRGEIAAMTFPQQGAVAIGEEAFFRGVVNNSFSHSFGEAWGLAGSSVVFGLAHSGDGISAAPLAATVYGAYLGWLHQRNDYRLGESVAIHFWWNVLVSLSALRYGPEDRTATVGISLPF